MKISINDRSKVAYWAFLCAVSKPEDKPKFDKILERRVDGTNDFDINLTINGEEFNFVDIMDRYSSELDRMIASAAMDIIKDKLGDITGRLFDIERLVMDCESEIKQKLNIQQD